MPSNDILGQMTTLFKRLSTGKIMGLALVIAGTVLAFAYLITWTGKLDFQALYSNLTPEDAGTIVGKLREMKTPYQISSNGSSVLVPGDQVYEIRMELASQGLPRGSGVGFEIFDNTKLGMTEFVQNVNFQRALQGEIARTINGFREIESSRVLIVMPSKSLFIEEEAPARASVALKLRPGRMLSKDQVRGIVHLVSSSISRLAPENVTVVDNYGKMLAGFEKKSGMGQISSDQLEFQEKLERNLEHRIKTMLEGALGPGKAITRVSCVLDFVRHEKTEELFYPDNKVVRSEQLLTEKSSGAEGGVVGAPGFGSNVPEQKEKQAVKNGESQGFQKQDRIMNYEIGKVTSHKVMPVGTITRMSVAVIVDGTHKRVKGKKRAKEFTYLPRSPEEMKKIENLVKSAVNFEPQRGDKLEVVNIPFEMPKIDQGEEVISKEGMLSKLKQYMPFMRYGFLGIFLFLSFVFVARPLVRWLTSIPIGDMELVQQLPMTVGEIEKGYGQGTQSLPFRDRATELLLGGDGEHGAELMRNWLKEEQGGAAG